MTFLTTGMDQMFWEPGGPITPNFQGLVARSVMQIPEFRQRYYLRVSELLTNVFKVESITNRMNWLEARISPALAEYDKGAAGNHRNAVNDLRNKIVQRAVNIRQQLDNQPKPLRFDPSGVATIGNWQPGVADGNVRHEEAIVDGRKALRIGFSGSARFSASWRARVPLPAGRYRFEGNIQTSHVPKSNDDGAVLRISGAQTTGLKRLAGDAGWTPLHFDFDLANEQEVVLVCELRASRGEAAFDLGSLRIVRVLK
ncbi:MAG: CotH kinase family protein [Opitutaceae bacterium]|nr:CotH kinase family protein [Verrucomicrobiales bacterium]